MIVIILLNFLALMKTLDSKTAKIIQAILAAGKKVIDNSQGTYMPVMVSTGRWRKGFRTVSLSQKNMRGDGSVYLTTVLFLHDKTAEKYIPFGYRNELSGIETYSIAINEGVPTLLDGGLQEDHTAFASMWLRDINIKHCLGQ